MLWLGKGQAHNPRCELCVGDQAWASQSQLTLVNGQGLE